MVPLGRFWESAVDWDLGVEPHISCHHFPGTPSASPQSLCPYPKPSPHCPSHGQLKPPKLASCFQSLIFQPMLQKLAFQGYIYYFKTKAIYVYNRKDVQYKKAKIKTLIISLFFFFLMDMKWQAELLLSFSPESAARTLVATIKRSFYILPGFILGL